MQLRFIYAPAPELKPTLAFHRDTLGWSEAWREGAGTVAFKVPDSTVQVMISVVGAPGIDAPPGPMYEVPSLSTYMDQHPELVVVVAEEEIPDGHVLGVADPAGNVLYLFDQVAD